MLVLLPPSEGKTPAPDGSPPVELGTLFAPDELTEVRRRVLAALCTTSARADALDVLGLAPGLAEEVARNVVLDSAPAAPAREVYTGVLYAAAGLASLAGPPLERAREHVRTVSALWGLVRPLDRVPAYRLSMGTTLPSVGNLAAAWREPLDTVLGPLAEGRLVVDCRSAAYLAAWRPGPAVRAWVTVRVVRDGKVVSHHAKHTRGVLTRHLLTRSAPVPGSVVDLLDAARELADAMLTEPVTAANGTSWRVLGATSAPGSGRHHHVLELEIG